MFPKEAEFKNAVDSVDLNTSRTAQRAFLAACLNLRTASPADAVVTHLFKDTQRGI